MINEQYEYIYVPDLNYQVEFITTDTSRVSNYRHKEPDPVFLSVKHPNAKIDRIDRISVYR
jgi:hypothetical protein